jgi:hypothetical protein
MTSPADFATGRLIPIFGSESFRARFRGGCKCQMSRIEHGRPNDSN